MKHSQVCRQSESLLLCPLNTLCLLLLLTLNSSVLVGIYARDYLELPQQAVSSSGPLKNVWLSFLSFPIPICPCCCLHRDSRWDMLSGREDVLGKHISVTRAVPAPECSHAFRRMRFGWWMTEIVYWTHHGIFLSLWHYYDQVTFWETLNFVTLCIKMCSLYEMLRSN